MRKSFLLALLLLTASLGWSQIVLTDADIGAYGTGYIMAIDTNVSGVTEGPAGANQNWDYASLSADVTDTIKFRDPANTPFSANYPNANLALFQPDLDGFAYLEATSTHLDLLGIAGDPLGLGETFVIPQIDPLRIAQFPLTYEDAFQDTAVLSATVSVAGLFPVGDSARYRTTSFRDLTVDAYGTLNLSSGSYNSIRVKEISTTYDSIWVLLPFIGWNLFQDTTYTDSSFTWWSNSAGYLLAEANYSGGSLTNMTFQNEALVSAAPAVELEFSVYPNPGQDFVRIGREKVSPAVVRIVDAQGKRLKEEKMLQKVHEISLAEFPTGIYFLRIEDTKGALLGVRRVSIQR